MRVTAGPGATVALPLTRAAHVVEFEPLRNIAIGAETPWGIGATTGRAAARHQTRSATPNPTCRPTRAPGRAAARWSWWSATCTGTTGCAPPCDRALAARPDAVVVELGVPELVTGAVHLATHGATRASGRAAAEVLTGAR